MIDWVRAIPAALFTEQPTARDAAILAAFVLIVPFGWLVLLVRPIRRLLRTL